MLAFLRLTRDEINNWMLRSEFVLQGWGAYFTSFANAALRRRHVGLIRIACEPATTFVDELVFIQGHALHVMAVDIDAPEMRMLLHFDFYDSAKSGAHFCSNFTLSMK